MGRTVRDTWLRLVGITLLAAMVLATDDTYQQPISGQVLAKLLFSLSNIILVWHLNRFIILYVRARLASGNQRIERLVITFVGCVLATTVLNWLVGAVQYWAFHGTLAGYVTQAKGISVTLNQVHFKLSYFGFDWLNGIINALFYVVLYSIVLFIQDTSQYRQRLEQAEREKEQLRVANLQSQLDVLKQQVNPHFLFNALNSLSSLISEDPEQAERFVDKLSDVYRYVLRANEQQVTTLEAELQFIEAYYHLLKTRYGAGLDLTVAVDEKHYTGQIPPLTLQLLVENAVKHNVVSPKRPLHIWITTTEQAGLAVSNTLQKKQSRVLSNGVGLTNIVAKYQMLNLPTPTISEADGVFTVTLSL